MVEHLHVAYRQDDKGKDQQGLGTVRNFNVFSLQLEVGEYSRAFAYKEALIATFEMYVATTNRAE